MKKNNFTIEKCLNMSTDDGFVEFIIQNNAFSKKVRKSTNQKRKKVLGDSKTKKDNSQTSTPNEA